MWTNAQFVAGLFFGVALGAFGCAALAGAFEPPPSTPAYFRPPRPLPPIKGPDERHDWRRALCKRAAGAGRLLWAGARADAGRAKRRLAAFCGASARALARAAAGLGGE